MDLSFLSRPILGMPAWLAGAVVIGGGVALAWWIHHRAGSSSSGALGQNAGAGNAAPADPNIDPNTGVPYAIESQINPATGLPAYYGTPGLNGEPAQTGSGPGTPPAPAPPGPGPANPGPILPPNHINPPGPGPFPTPVRTPTGPIPMGAPAAAGPRAQVVHAATWPSPDSSLFSIWQNHARGIPFPQWEQQVRALNPQITNPNLIYPNEAIRIPA